MCKKLVGFFFGPWQNDMTYAVQFGLKWKKMAGYAPGGYMSNEIFLSPLIKVKIYIIERSSDLHIASHPSLSKKINFQVDMFHCNIFTSAILDRALSTHLTIGIFCTLLIYLFISISDISFVSVMIFVRHSKGSRSPN